MTDALRLFLAAWSTAYAFAGGCLIGVIPNAAVALLLAASLFHGLCAIAPWSKP